MTPDVSPAKEAPKLSSKIPGLPLLGHALAVMKDPLQFSLRAQEHFPELCQLNVGPRKLHLIFHPDHIRHVLQKNSKNYNKDTFITDSLKVMLGDGLLTSDGQEWHKNRRMVQPVFHFQRLRNHFPIVLQSARKLAQDWKQRSQSATADYNISDELMKLTLGIISQVTLGEDLSHYSEQVDSEFPFITKQIYTRSMNLWNPPLKCPFPSNKRLLKIRGDLDQIIYSLIEKRKTQSDLGHDLLGMLLRAQDEQTGLGLSMKQIRDEVMTIFLAGHETTANSLMWFFYLMHMNPEIDQKLTKELQNVEAKEAADFEKLPYLHACIQESMRVYPAGWSLVRRSIGEDRLGDYRIPPKSYLIIFPYATHKHRDFWTDPMQFKPERFLDESAEKTRHKFSFFPFGGGPRICIGQPLAQMMIEGILYEILRMVRLELSPTCKVVEKPETTLGMKNPLIMRLHSR